MHPNIDRYHLTESQSRGYAPADWEILDYEMYKYPETNLYFRGPQLSLVNTKLSGDIVVSFIGAAQIFRRFVEKPLPNLIAERTGFRALNLGFSGASPSLFLENEILLEAINHTSCCVVQFMSARGISNRLFDADPNRMNRLTRRSDGERMFADVAYREALSTLPAGSVFAAVEESREGYIQEMNRLLSRIKVPGILLWFSDRFPTYEIGFDHYNRLYGGFPQFVNDEIVRTICTTNPDWPYVEAVSSAGRSHLLFSRFDGEPVNLFPHHSPSNENYYYPTPQMHLDAADKLEPILKGLLLQVRGE